jgi:hypothetical protein
MLCCPFKMTMAFLSAVAPVFTSDLYRLASGRNNAAKTVVKLQIIKTKKQINNKLKKIKCQTVSQMVDV